jgi:dynein heavy chain
MYSAFGEYVEFLEEIHPFDGESNVRNVEEWLGEVEDMMKNSLKDVTDRCGRDFSDETRAQWTKDWTGQIILT